MGGWLVPSGVLVLMPKCPFCVAGYLAAAGIGVSLPMAAGLRFAVIGACLSALGFVVSKSLARAIR